MITCEPHCEVIIKNGEPVRIVQTIATWTETIESEMVLPFRAWLPTERLEMTDKLLQVLDMTGEEKWKWLENKFPDDSHCCCGTPICLTGRQELADLAFRLRNEVKNRWRYYQALRLIFRRWSEKKQSRGIDFRCWLGTFITPTDMIVAALKAKELAKE